MATDKRTRRVSKLVTFAPQRYCGAIIRNLMNKSPYGVLVSLIGGLVREVGRNEYSFADKAARIESLAPVSGMDADLVGGCPSLLESNRSRCGFCGESNSL